MESKTGLEYFYIFAADSEKKNKNGGLAQLARAFDWQSKGHRFDSDILHDEFVKSTENEHNSSVRFYF